MNLDGKPLPDADRMRLHADMEDEGTRAISIVAEALDHARFAKCQRMTARQFALLTEPEKRMYLLWVEGFARTFNEKASMMRRNTRPGPELPAALRAHY